MASVCVAGKDHAVLSTDSFNSATVSLDSETVFGTVEGGSSDAENVHSRPMNSSSVVQEDMLGTENLSENGQVLVEFHDADKLTHFISGTCAILDSESDSDVRDDASAPSHQRVNTGIDASTDSPAVAQSLVSNSVNTTSLPNRCSSTEAEVSKTDSSTKVMSLLSLEESSTAQAAMFWAFLFAPGITCEFFLYHSTWSIWFLAVSSALVVVFPAASAWSILLRNWILYKLLFLVMPSVDAPTESLRDLIIFVKMGPAGALIQVGLSLVGRVSKIVKDLHAGPVQQLSQLVKQLVAPVIWLAPMLNWLPGGQLRKAILRVRDIASLPGRHLTSLQATTRPLLGMWNASKDLWLGPGKIVILALPLTIWELIGKHLFTVALTLGSWTGKPKINVPPVFGIRKFSLGLTRIFTSIRDTPRKIRREFSALFDMLRSVINLFRALGRLRRA